ncbi:hypothetical protein MKEN_00141200 [Mycena kentingensis (nom. inval.)]|nr:hypothetical protein MKEN_00141200 [Mycena kentingensis (nom. inval.)]
MLGQREIGKYLDEWSGNLTAIEEILSAYIVWKYLKGASSSRVLVKIKYLAMYLRFSGRAHILAEAADIFKVLTIEVSIGGGRIGLLPSRTTPGKEIWNRIRREAPARLRRRGITGATYGGPVPVQSFLTQSQREPWQPNQERTPWAEQFFLARQRFGEAPVIHEHTTAGHRETTLPFYETRTQDGSVSENASTTQLPLAEAMDALRETQGVSTSGDGLVSYEQFQLLEAALREAEAARDREVREGESLVSYEQLQLLDAALRGTRVSTEVASSETAPV